MRSYSMGWRVVVVCVLLAACREREVVVVLPTEVDINAAATAAVLTREAPPQGFETVSFPQIDQNTANLDHYRAEVSLSFEGNFARTPRLASATTTAMITVNRAQQAKRVESSFVNNLQDGNEPVQLDAVRLGEDDFVVQNGRCLTNADQAELATQLSAAAVLGGVQQAESAAQRATLNGEAVWLYRFDAEDLVLPNVQQIDNSRIVGLSGELWVSPATNTVIRYYLNLDVENVTLFGEALPVTGSLLLRYDLYLHEDAANINVPFGC
jgi:hypothetical protein